MISGSARMLQPCFPCSRFCPVSSSPSAGTDEYAISPLVSHTMTRCRFREAFLWVSAANEVSHLYGCPL